MSYHVMLCYVMVYFVLLCCLELFYRWSGKVGLCCVRLCYVMLYVIILCFMYMFYYAVLCLFS